MKIYFVTSIVFIFINSCVYCPSHGDVICIINKSNVNISILHYTDKYWHEKKYRKRFSDDKKLIYAEGQNHISKGDTSFIYFDYNDLKCSKKNFSLFIFDEGENDRNTCYRKRLNIDSLVKSNNYLLRLDFDSLKYDKFINCNCHYIFDGKKLVSTPLPD